MRTSGFYKWFYTHHGLNVRRFRGLSDYEHLPTLTKDAILLFTQTHGTENAWCLRDQPLVTPTTTGTLGRRLRVPFTRNDIERFATDVLFAVLGHWGSGSGRFNGVVAESSQDLTSVVFADVAAKRNGAVFRYADLRRQPDGSPSRVAGETLVFMTLPSLREALERPPGLAGMRRINVKHILSPVAPRELTHDLHAEMKARLSDINLIPVYGSVEMGLVGGATPDTFHDAFIQIVQPGLFHISDENGTLRDTGVGKLVYTSLGREAFPFIKYEVGDVVTIRDSDTLALDGGSSRVIRFERRTNPLSVKVPDAAGYFIDILKLEEIVKEILPFSQILCVHAQRAGGGGSFVAVFIGTPQALPGQRHELIRKIVEGVVLNHVTSQKIQEVGMSALLSRFLKLFPVFFVDVGDIPKEPTASKPRLLLDLVTDANVPEQEIYRNLLSRFHADSRRTAE